MSADLDSWLAEFTDGGLDWVRVERDTAAAGLALVQFSDGLALVRREDELWGLVWSRGSGQPTDALVGPDRALVRNAFARGVSVPGYSTAEFRDGTADERFVQAVRWIAAWRPRDILGALTSPSRPA